MYKVLVGKPEGKNNLKDPSVERRIILKWMVWDVGAWSGSIWLRIWTVGGHL